MTPIRSILLILPLIHYPLALPAQPSWYPTGSPNGGVVSSLVLDSHGQIFASTLYRGVFSSRDGGDTWMYRNTTLPVRQIRTMVISDGDLYVGTSKGHVFKSRDGAETWSLIAHLPSEIHDLSVDAQGRIFAGSGGEGVFRLEKDDNTWEETGLKHVSVQCLASGPDGELYAGTNLGLYLTTDGGYTWRSIEIPDIYVFSLAVDRRGTLFAGTWAGRLYRSRTRGRDWTVIDLGPRNSVIWSLCIDEKGHVFAAAEGGGILRSMDGGIQWETMNDGLTDLSVRSIAVSESGIVYVGTTNGMVFRTSPDSLSGSSRKPASGLSQFFGIH